MPVVSSMPHLVVAILFEVVAAWVINGVDGLNSLTVRPLPAATA